MARKLALIIGNSQYEDAYLSKLAAPDVDVRALAEVLSTPGIGAFDEVTQLLNEGLATVRKSIARFFDLKHRDDLLFLYFSGHGVRDEQGHLYLAVRDTERVVLAGTAIEASFVTARMDRSASKRLVLVLDCCHSGAFGYGAKAAHGAAVGTATAFEGTGRGRVVLTATDSTQYAWEGDQVLGEVENSLFTHHMIEGLRTGAADRDEDGLITIDELYDYVYEHVLNETPKQTPGKWAYGQQGEIVIAQNAAASRAKLPQEIEEAVRSTLPSVRLEAVRELDSILRGRHVLRSGAAREVLKRLAEDDSRRVAAAAIDILKAFEHGTGPVQPEALAREIEIEKRKEIEKERVAEEARRVEETRARAAEAARQLAAAQSALGRGALDDARELLAQALEIEPQHADALRLLHTLQQRIEERARLEEAEQRIRELRQRIGTLIARANATTSHDEAIALLNEALGLDPEHAEVKELLEERHRLRLEAAAERRARSIATVKERIVRHIERGELEEAEHALTSADSLAAPEEFAPLRQRLAQVHAQRHREAEEAARQKAKAERRARDEQIARQLATARSAIERQRFNDALDALEQASTLDAQAAGIADLVQKAEAGKAAAEAEARKRVEIEAQLSEASRHLTRGHLTKAIVIADVVLGLDPEHAAAKALQADIQRAIEAQKEAERHAAQERERRRQIEDMIATAEAAPTHDTAIEILDDVLTRDPGNSRAQRLLNKRQADLDALKAEQRRGEIATTRETIEEQLSRKELDLASDELDAAERRFQSTAEFRTLRERLQGVRRDEELERLARAAVLQAQEDFARGNHQRAITDLGKFRPKHAIASEALQALKAQADEIRRVQQEQEEQARIEAEREARQERVARLMAAAQAAVNQQRFQEAVEAVEQLRALAPDVAGLQQLSEAAQDGLEVQRAAENARREAELERREIDQTLARAGKRQRRRDYAAALALVDGVLARDSQHPAALSLRAEVQRAIEEQAAHPDVGFSLRPTLSAATVWLRTKALYSTTFRISGGLVLAAAVSIGVWRSGSEPWPASRPTHTSPVTPTPAPPPPEPKTGLSKETTPPQQTTQAPAGGVESPKPEAAPPEVIAVRDERLAAAERRARQQLGAGNGEGALRSAQRGLAVDANDTALLALVSEILRDAESRAMRARRAAEKVGAAAVSSKEFDAARLSQADADRLRDAGQHQEAIRGYWEATRLFTKAAEATPPAPPSPVNTQPGAQAAVEAIERVRQQYEAAVENRSIEELRAVWPSMSRTNLKVFGDKFNEAGSLAIDLTCQQPVFVDLQRAQSGRTTTATMSCYETQRGRSRAGGVSWTMRGYVTFYLRGEGPLWVITDVTTQVVKQ